MKILGIDNGYSFTKDSDGNIFKSSFTTSQMLMSSEKITICDKTYYVGNGATTCDVNKISSEMNMVTTVACMCRHKENVFRFVVGLPIGQYNLQKDELREEILSYNALRIKYNGNDKKICIEDVIVAPQGASALYCGNIKDDCVIVDVGGLTIDVAQIDFIGNSPTIVKSSTYYKGVRTLYSSIIEEINMKFNLRLEVEEADKIIRNGFYYLGEKKSLDFLQPILIDYITPIYEELKLNYNTDTKRIILMGGGAKLLQRAMCKRFGHVTVLDNCQFVNAYSYYKLGVKKWGDLVG